MKIKLNHTLAYILVNAFVILPCMNNISFANSEIKQASQISVDEDEDLLSIMGTSEIEERVSDINELLDYDLDKPGAYLSIDKIISIISRTSFGEYTEITADELSKKKMNNEQLEKLSDRHKLMKKYPFLVSLIVNCYEKNGVKSSTIQKMASNLENLMNEISNVTNANVLNKILKSLQTNKATNKIYVISKNDKKQSGSEDKNTERIKAEIKKLCTEKLNMCTSICALANQKGYAEWKKLYALLKHIKYDPDTGLYTAEMFNEDRPLAEDRAGWLLTQYNSKASYAHDNVTKRVKGLLK